MQALYALQGERPVPAFDPQQRGHGKGGYLRTSVLEYFFELTDKLAAGNNEPVRCERTRFASLVIGFLQPSDTQGRHVEYPGGRR